MKKGGGGAEGHPSAIATALPPISQRVARTPNAKLASPS